MRAFKNSTTNRLSKTFHFEQRIPIFRTTLSATESRYIGVFRDILEELNIKMLCLSDFEVCNNIPEIRQYKRNKVLNVDASCLFLTNCLRENCWGRLKSKRAKWFNAYVGYDYYLHINAINWNVIFKVNYMIKKDV